MKCSRFGEIVCDLAADRLAEGRERREAMEHLRFCLGCADLLADQRAVSAELGALAAAYRAERAPDRVEAALQAAFARRSHVPWYARFGAATAAAACLLLALGLGGALVLQRRHDGITPAQTEVAAVAEHDGDGSFIALPFAEGAAPLEEGQVVRVLLPASVLPGTATPAGEVAADVVLGPDGIARSIRFLE